MTPEALLIDAVVRAVLRSAEIVAGAIFLAYVIRGCYRAWQALLDGAAEDYR